MEAVVAAVSHFLLAKILKRVSKRLLLDYNCIGFLLVKRKKIDLIDKNPIPEKEVRSHARAPETHAISSWETMV